MNPLDMVRTVTTASIGPLLRRWREHRHLSQLELSSIAAVSQRHLSHVETGKSRPSREMVLHLAETLDVPLRDRNALLLAAGLAPAYSETSLDDPATAQVRRGLNMMLEAHSPFPAVIVDRHWNLLQANPAATTLVGSLVDAGSAALTAPLNVMRLTFHPQGLRSAIVNWNVLGPALAARVRREADASPEDDELVSLATELAGQLDPGLHVADPSATPDLLVPVHYRNDDIELRLFTTIAHLGSPLDVTLAELSIELFYPADDTSADVLKKLNSD